MIYGPAFAAVYEQAWIIETESLLTRAHFHFERYDGRTLRPATEHEGRLLYVCRPTAVGRHRTRTIATT